MRDDFPFNGTDFDMQQGRDKLSHTSVRPLPDSYTLLMKTTQDINISSIY